MYISLDTKLSEIKTIIDRRIDANNSPVTLHLEFKENSNSRSNKFDLNYLKQLLKYIKKSYPNVEFKYEITYIKQDYFYIDTQKCEELEEFIKARIEKSIAKTKYYFDVSECHNAFAKELNNKIPNLVKKQ